MSSIEPVAVVDEGDEGLFIDFVYSEDGNPLRRGDKLYRIPADHCEESLKMVSPDSAGQLERLLIALGQAGVAVAGGEDGEPWTIHLPRMAPVDNDSRASFEHAVAQQTGITFDNVQLHRDGDTYVKESLCHSWWGWQARADLIKR